MKWYRCQNFFYGADLRRAAAFPQQCMSGYFSFNFSLCLNIYKIWSLSIVQCDRYVCAQPTGVLWASGFKEGTMFFLKPRTLVSQFSYLLVWTVRISIWQSKAMAWFNLWTSPSHSSSTYCFSLGLIQLSFHSVKGLPLSSRWTGSGRTEPVHKLGPDLPIPKFKGQWSHGKSLPLTSVECGAMQTKASP